MTEHKYQLYESNKACLHELFEVQVNKTPNAIAVFSENERLTYKELSQQANQVAHYLQSLGVGSGILVAVYMESCLELAICIVAILKAGGVCVPLDPSDPPDRQVLLLENTDVPVLLTHKHLANQIPQIDSHIIYADEFDELLAHESQDILPIEIQADELAFIFGTSGSTGKPKGVMLSHEACSYGLSWARETFGLTEQDRHLLKTSISFVSLLRQFIWALLTGASTFLLPVEKRGDLAYEAKLVAEQRITILSFIPSVLRFFLELPEIEACTSLRHVICGGEPITEAIRKQFFNRLSAELHNVYAMSEAPLVTHWQCKRNSKGKDSVGRIIPGVQVYLLDANLSPVPIEVEGEIYIGGPVIAQGYLKHPNWTAEKFISLIFSNESEVRLYKTGDKARRLRDGTIEYLGRSDSLVKIHGYRIELGEVQNVLEQHPAIKEAVVLVKEDQNRNKKLIAYVVLKENKLSLSFSDLREFLQQKIPQYMIPSALILLDTLPRLFNGKVNKISLAQLKPRMLTTTQSITTSYNVIELQLITIWEEVLGIHTIGIHDNFFELGGNSLLAVRLFNKVEEIFGRKITPAKIYNQVPTVARLAYILNQEENSVSYSLLLPIQTKGVKRPFFCLPPGGVLGGDFSLIHLSNLLGLDQPFYGFRIPGLETKQNFPFSSIEEIAGHCIKEMQIVQPEGPYLLGGFCFGGNVAFEIAQQLLKQGHKVNLLAILDSIAPSSKFQSPLFSYKITFYKILFVLSKALNLNSKDKLKYILERFKWRVNNISYKLYSDSGNSMPPELQYVHGEEFSKHLLKKYNSSIYPGRIVLFRSNKMIAEQCFGSDMGWSQFAKEGVDTYNLPGHFGELRSESNIHFLAEHLKRCINIAMACS